MKSLTINTVYITPNGIKIEDVVKVAREGYKVALSKESSEAINKARELVDRYVKEERVVYGLTTGFGKFSDVAINKDETGLLQRNLIISHACGVGKPLPEETVRALMLLRVNALSRGYSGIRLSTVNVLIEMLNKGVHPYIPEQGSLGASGDLAPLSHMVLTMLGEGEAYYEGELLSSKEAMEKAGISTIELTSKEGLALINGTQVMTAIGALGVYDAVNLMKAADICAALTMEALEGIVDAYDHKVHEVRGHKGQINTAKNVLNLLEGSQRVTRQGEKRVQDAYALRCTPQIHGASKDAIEYVKSKIEIEINAVTDNPIIFPEQDEVISGGNFHGQPIALVMDFMAIAVSEIANISERRLERLVNPALSNGLPAFLSEKGGLNSGFMIVQYSAASLVSENKVLSHPASVDSIPSSANQEDHVSMGTIGARKASKIIEHAQNVLGMEMMGACQGIDLREKAQLGKGTELAYKSLRAEVAMLKEDRVMYKDINKCVDIIKKAKIINDIEDAIGNLTL